MWSSSCDNTHRPWWAGLRTQLLLAGCQYPLLPAEASGMCGARWLLMPPLPAGNRGYYLKREGVLLNQALINAALQFGYKRDFQPVHTPFFMQASAAARPRI